MFPLSHSSVSFSPQVFSLALSPLRPLHWTHGMGQVPDLGRYQGNVYLPGREGSVFPRVPGPRPHQLHSALHLILLHLLLQVCIIICYVLCRPQNQIYCQVFTFHIQEI